MAGCTLSCTKKGSATRPKNQGTFQLYKPHPNRKHMAAKSADAQQSITKIPDANDTEEYAAETAH
jgi:hypothetical protein